MPPLSTLTGMRLTEFEPGSATFTMPLSPWLAGADGTIPLGVLTMPADAAMACAIIAALPAGTGLTTSELSIRQVSPARIGDTVVARATMLDAGPPVALAEVTLTDAAGTLIARGGSLCVTLPALSAPPAPGRTDADTPRPVETEPMEPAAAAVSAGDPWQRPLPEGEPGGADVLSELAREIAGTRDPAPISRLTGLRPVVAIRGEVTFALPATGWLCAPPPGRVQGGAVAVLADAAITGAIRTTEPGAGRYVPVELKLNYLRPLPSDGRLARAHARLIHAGRRVAVAGAEVVDADGRAIAVASGSAVAGA